MLCLSNSRCTTVTPGLQKDINRAIIYVPGSSHTYICNTRFIKGHKPRNHIRARIKSHVYTTVWTIYHSTYHVKRCNKASTKVIYYINDKNVWYSGSVKTYTKSLGSWAPQGRRLGDERLEVLVLLVALGALPRVSRNGVAVEHTQKITRGKE